MNGEVQQFVEVRARLQVYDEEIRAEIKIPEARQRFRKNVLLLIWGLRSLTMTEFAKRVGCSPSHVSRMLDEDQDLVLLNLGHNILFNIAKVLGVPPRILLQRDLGKELEQLIQQEDQVRPVE